MQVGCSSMVISFFLKDELSRWHCITTADICSLRFSSIGAFGGTGMYLRVEIYVAGSLKQLYRVAFFSEWGQSLLPTVRGGE